MKNNLLVWLLFLPAAASGYGDGLQLSADSSSYSTQGVRTNLRDKTSPEEFIRENYSEIKEEAAAGKGDYLHIATKMLVKDKNQRKKFKKALKKKYKKIFKHGPEKGTKKILALAKKY